MLPILNSRQKELLRTLLIANKPVPYKELSEMFKVSTRTIQREMNALKSILDDYDLKIGRKIGSGLELKGRKEEKEKVKKLIEETKTLSAYSPEERQEGITYDLLLSKEPIKQYVFGKKYGVTEATISYDLDKVSAWFSKGEVTLIRSPGIGIFIDGTEQQRRTLLSRLLHKDITFEEWLELFHGRKNVEALQGKLGVVIRNRLLKIVQTDKILDVERVVHQVLEKQPDIELTDRNYVNLIVHLILALERTQSGEVIEEPQIIQDVVVDSEMYSIAEQIVTQLEKEISITIPKIEVSYIYLHLVGARLAKGKKVMNDDGSEEFTWIELTKSFIRAVEHFLEESFAGDELLSEGLVSHFAPSLNRLKHGLQIHNPMLKKIKERYPDIYTACQKACELLSEKTGFAIPDDEVGYLAMHIGAALIRRKNLVKKEFKAIVVCASGLGTSTYLASRIRNEMPNIHVEAVISMNQLDRILKEQEGIDIVISTVNLSNVHNENIVIVSPFLKEEDIARIQVSLTNVGEQKFSRKNVEVPHLLSSSLMSLAKYGEAIMQILRNLQIYDNVNETPLVLPSILNHIRDVEVVKELETLFTDLEKRERQGGFVLGDLAMIHAKTEGVKQLLVVIFRLEKMVPWKIDEEEQPIKTVILLTAPKHAPKEHIEMISEISAMFVDETFVNVLSSAESDVVINTIEEVLSKAYEVKAARALKESKGK
ncbi:PRD domain-containing protein [Bacillus timonensis]|uniref:PRD domain-containing protein n=1 Tax=Bacillus timonensis TaxID=1033734 RepID=A0A4V3V7S4_9BACI|nr:BglG family transcription antiterminator [Bacillus timonensis]THE12443.1 PRD domain-containing protein [Bacillus timonensis]